MRLTFIPLVLSQLNQQPEFVNLCFWYKPPSLRGKEQSEDYEERLAKVAPVIKERMMKQGSMMVGYQPLGNKTLALDDLSVCGLFFHC